MLANPVTTPTTPADAVIPVPPMPPVGAGPGFCWSCPVTAGRPVPPMPPSEAQPRAANAVPAMHDASAQVSASSFALSLIALQLLRLRSVHRLGVEVQPKVHAPLT